MNKGFTTLMTVAIALVSVQAMAKAPVLQDIPSPIIGNKASTGAGTVAEKFVYADAFNLRQLATDDLTTSVDLKWSYEIVGTPAYTINGVAPINSTIDDPNGVTTKDLNKSGTDKWDVDKLPYTVTIRNSRLRPLATDVPGSDPTSGFIDKQAVTFFCSDGTGYSSQTLFFYTDNQMTNGQPTGWNRLSTSITPEAVDTFTKSWSGIEGPFGVVTTSTFAATKAGICFEVPKAGNNMFSMHSKYAFFTLNKNKVYRIRATMNGSQTTVGKTPFWDFIVENWNDNIKKGLNLYGMDSYYLDNEGGASSVISTGSGTEFTMVWAPLAFRTTQWNGVSSTTGVFATKYSTDKDPYLRFRVMDSVNNAGLQSDQKFGKLCLTKVVVESLDYPSGIVSDGADYVNLGGTGNPFRRAGTKNTAGTAFIGNVQGSGLVSTQVVYGSTLTLTPTGAATTAELATVIPNVDNSTAIAPPYTQIADDWPIPWTSKKLIQMDVQMSAPTANDALHPFEVIWFSMEPPTNELSTESYVTANSQLASPSTTPQTYTFFYWTGNETKSAVPQLHYLRWRIRFASNAGLRFPKSTDINNNNGAVRIHSIVVKPVKIAGQ